jgi:hypothetical protein
MHRMVVVCSVPHTSQLHAVAILLLMTVFDESGESLQWGRVPLKIYYSMSG